MGSKSNEFKQKKFAYGLWVDRVFSLTPSDHPGSFAYADRPDQTGEPSSVTDLVGGASYPSTATSRRFRPEALGKPERGREH